MTIAEFCQMLMDMANDPSVPMLIQQHCQQAYEVSWGPVVVGIPA